MMLAVALLTTFQLTAHAPTDSIGGKWQVKGDVAGNPVDTTCDITQTGTALSGTCTINTAPPTPLTGQVKGDSVTFQHGGDYQGQEITIIYTGKLDPARQLKGTILVKPFDASGTFTAQPAPTK